MDDTTTSKPSISQLEVHLFPTSSHASVQVSIQNTNPTQAMTILIWNSPFDTLAPLMGILALSDSHTGEPLPSPGLMMQRTMPPSRNALIEIPAQGSVERNISLSHRLLPYKGPVKVHAAGRWLAVWTKAIDDISRTDLESMSGPDVMAGHFQGMTEAVVDL